MDKPHDIIYLQWDDETNSEDEGVTWCQDSINDTDIMYIRHDLHLAEIKKLKTLLKKLYEDKHEPDKLYTYWPEVKKALKD